MSLLNCLRRAAKRRSSSRVDNGRDISGLASTMGTGTGTGDALEPATRLHDGRPHDSARRTVHFDVIRPRAACKAARGKSDDKTGTSAFGVSFLPNHPAYKDIRKLIPACRQINHSSAWQSLRADSGGRIGRRRPRWRWHRLRDPARSPPARISVRLPSVKPDLDFLPYCPVAGDGHAERLCRRP